MDARADARRLHLLHHRGAPHVEPRLRKHDLEHVPVAVGEVRHRKAEPQVRRPFKLLEVGLRQLAAPGGELLKVRELAEADPRRDVGHVVFAAHQLDLHAVVAGPHDALEAVLLGERGLALVVQHEASALGGRDVLVRVEADRDKVPEGADPPALPCGAEGLRRVLDDPQVVLLRDGAQPVAVDREAGQVDRDDRACPGRHGLLQAVQVNGPGCRVDVHEDGPGADLQDHVARGDPGQAGS